VIKYQFIINQCQSSFTGKIKMAKQIPKHLHADTGLKDQLIAKIPVINYFS